MNLSLKTMLQFLFIPISILLLILLNYGINVLIDSTLVKPYIIPYTSMHPHIASYVYNGLFDGTIAFFLLFLLLGMLDRKPLSALGFQCKGFGQGFKITLLFTCGFMFVYIVLGIPAANQQLFDYSFPFPLTSSNLIQWLIFECFISGFEEIYFRCFVILLLSKWWRTLFSNLKYLDIAVILASTFIFAVRHIGITFKPFSITYFSPLHLLVVTIMGIFLGVQFIRTKSFFAVYAAHGLLNGCITIFLLVLNIVLG